MSRPVRAWGHSVEQLWRHFGWLVPPVAIGAVAVVALTAAVLWIRDGHRTGPRFASRVMLDGLLATWALGLLGVTLFPKQGFTGERPVQLVPLAGILDSLLSSVTIWVVVAQIGGNVVLFLPFGLLARLRTRLGLGRIAAAGAAIVTAIELCQLASGTGRVASVDDVLLAVVATALGWTLAFPFTRARVVRTQDVAASPSTPSRVV